MQALNRHAEAVASFDKALAIDKSYADAHSNRALSLLTLGELARGFAEYEWRWKRAGMTDLRRNYRGALWLGEYPLARKRILLHAEQGLGDTIQFARYVPLVARMGATVVLEVQPELKPLFEGMAGAAFVHARGEPLPAYDLHCPLGSLPLALKTAPATIPADLPYLHADAARIAAWRPRIEALPGKRVALAWAGHARHVNDRNRSLALSLLEPLLAVPGVSFVSLQRDLREGDAARLAAHRNVTHVGEALERHGRDRRGADAVRPYDRGRHLGGASGRRARAPGLGHAAVFARLALDARRRTQSLVSANAAVAPERARRLAGRGRAGMRKRWRSSRVRRRRGSRSAPARADAPCSQSRAARWARPISAVAHLLGDFAPQPRAVAVAAHGRDVEPLVRFDEIDRDPRPRRIDHAATEAAFRVGRLRGGRCRQFDVSHCRPPHVARGQKAPMPAGASLLPGRKLRPSEATMKQKI